MKKAMATGITAASLLVAAAGAAGAANPGTTTGKSGGAKSDAQIGVAKGGTKEGTSSFDRYWLNESASGDIYEVAVGKLAQQNGGSDGVKSFGSTLVKDHTKSLQDTNAVGKKLGVKMETKPNPLLQQVLALLSKMNGTQFDTLFTQLAVGDHRLDIEDAQRAASMATANDVRTLARKEMPTLQKHLREATKLAQEQTSSQSGASSGSSSSSGNS
jgi:putative membrane protein